MNPAFTARGIEKEKSDYNRLVSGERRRGCRPSQNGTLPLGEKGIKKKKERRSIQ